MIHPPDLTRLSHAEKDALILASLAQLAAAHERVAAQDTRIAALEARFDELTDRRRRRTIPPNPRLRVRSKITRKARPAGPARAAPAWAGRCIRTPTG